jgi:hypothetical protein
MQRLFAAAIAVVLMSIPACGGGDNPPVDAPTVPRETITMTKPLLAGEIIEAEMLGGASDRALIRLAAPVSELDWNLHAHPDGSGVVTVHEELDVMTVEYDFIPTEIAEWYLLLKNSGSDPMDVEVEVDLFGAMSFAFL